MSTPIVEVKLQELGHIYCVSSGLVQHIVAQGMIRGGKSKVGESNDGRAIDAFVVKTKPSVCQ